MTADEAEHRIAVAGRELGPGRAAAIERLVGDLADREARRSIARQQRSLDEWKERLADALERGDERTATMSQDVISQRGEVDEQQARQLAAIYARGVAVGLVMAEDPQAMATLAEIREHWRRTSAE